MAALADRPNWKSTIHNERPTAIVGRDDGAISPYAVSSTIPGMIVLPLTSMIFAPAGIVTFPFGPTAAILSVSLMLDHLGLAKEAAKSKANIRPDAEVELAIISMQSAFAEGDSILWAGPGHQDYRDIRGVRTPYSARAEARDALRESGWA